MTEQIPAIILLLNGPPRSGKDTVADMLVHYFHEAQAHSAHNLQINAEIIKFAEPLRQSMQAFVAPLVLNNARDMQPERWAEAIELIKENQIDRYPMTVRQAMISLSEEWAKKFFSPQVFGEVARNRMEARFKTNDLNIFIVSDSGFKDEADVIIEAFGVENVHLAQIHRRDHDFTGDSRSYLVLDCDTIRIQNNGDLNLLTTKSIAALQEIIYAHVTYHTANQTSVS